MQSVSLRIGLRSRSGGAGLKDMMLTPEPAYVASFLSSLPVLVATRTHQSFSKVIPDSAVEVSMMSIKPGRRSRNFNTHEKVTATLTRAIYDRIFAAE